MAEPGSITRQKIGLIAGLWLVQFAFFYAVPSVFMGLNEKLSLIPEDLLDPQYALFGLFVATMMSAVQGAFLLPIREPRAKNETGPSPLRLFAVAACLSIIVGGVVGYVAVELSEGGVLSLSDTQAYVLFWCVSGGLILPMFYVLLRRFRRRLPVVVSMIMAAFLAGLVLTGLICGVMGVVRLITDVDTPRWVWAWIMIPAPLVGWAVFTPIVIAFVRKGPPEARLSRLAARLLIGTTIEAVAVTPVHVMVRRKTSCYCDEASFWSLVATISVGLVTLGPAVYLLVWKKYHLRVAEGHCRACGYDMAGNIAAERCPECGAGWRVAPAEDAVKATS